MLYMGSELQRVDGGSSRLCRQYPNFVRTNIEL
jgi:hypothetical protein